MLSDYQTTYKGYNIEVSECGDEDCSKAWHELENIETGERFVADITPFDWSLDTVKLFIDAGCPGRLVANNCPLDEIISISWDRKLLQQYIDNGFRLPSHLSILEKGVFHTVPNDLTK